MKAFHLIAGACTLSLSLLTTSVRAKVYVNRIKDEKTGEFKVGEFYRQGETVTFTRGYQNEYGGVHGLKPGPPFILESSVRAVNTHTPDGTVDQWGRLRFVSGGAGGLGEEPFTIAGNSATLRAEGGIEFIGSTLDPITLSGVYELVSGTTNQLSMRDTVGPECTWSHTNFTGSFLPEAANASPLAVTGHHLTVQSCFFSFPSADFTIPFTVVDIGVHVNDCTRVWDFAMHNCRFEGLQPAAYALELGYLHSVTIEDCHFKNVAHPNANNGGGLVGIRECGLQSIRKNTQKQCSVPAIVCRNACRANQGARIKTNDSLPLSGGFTDIPEDSSLTIERGSVLKGTGGFRVRGSLTIDSSVVTSISDTEYGADIDAGSSLFTYWSGASCAIHVDTTGSVSLTNSLLRYAGGGIRAYGDLTIRGCTLERFTSRGILLSGAGEQDYLIRNTTIRGIEEGMAPIDAAIRYENRSNHAQSLEIDDVDIIANTVSGISATFVSTAPARIEVRNSRVISNAGHCVYVAVAPALASLRITNTAIVGNGGSGIEAPDLQGEGVPLTLESNLVWGNDKGVVIANGTPSVINNTIAYNDDRGLSMIGCDNLSDQAVANNMFYRNTGAGYHDGNAEDPLCVCNAFRENGEGPLLYRHGSRWLYTIEELQGLGEEFTTNRDAPPGFVPEITGTLTAFDYDDRTGLSALVDTSRSFAVSEPAGRFICPDTALARWHLVSHVKEDSLFVFGDVSSYASREATYRIHDHHLSEGSALIDAGRDSLMSLFMDVDSDARVIDGDEDGLVDVDIGADEYNPGAGYEAPITVTSPAEGSFFLAGDRGTIRWEPDTVGSARILFCAHPDSTSPSWDTVAAGIEGSTGSHDWTAPRVLSAECVIRVESEDEPSLFGLSKRFTVKTWHLTRLTEEGRLVPFRPHRDAWRFANRAKNLWPPDWYARFDYSAVNDPFTGQPYPVTFHHPLFIGAKPADFPDWPSFVRAFGTDQCYVDIDGQLHYRIPALGLWRDARHSWSGSCFGLGTAVSLAFLDSAAFVDRYPSLPDSACVHALDTGATVREVVTELFAHQYGADHQAYMNARFTMTPREVLAAVKNVFADNYINGPLLAIGSTDDSTGGSHVVSPYRLERDTIRPGVYLLYVYDSNYPSPDTATIPDTIVLDSTTNTWFSNHYPDWGDSSGFCYLLDSSASYLDPPALVGGGGGGSGPLASAGEGMVDFLHSGATDLVLEDGDGRRTGAFGDTVYTAIPEASPRLHLGVPSSRPYGYRVPSGDYAIRMASATDTAMALSVWDGPHNYRYARGDVRPWQVDELSYDSTGLRVTNTDTATKGLRLSCIHQGATEDRQCFLHGLTVAQGEELLFSSRQGERFILHDRGSGQVLDIVFWTVGTAGEEFVQTEGVELPSGAIGVLIPQWDQLGLGEVSWLVDVDADGSYDDTTVLSTTPGLGLRDRRLPAPIRSAAGLEALIPMGRSTKIVYGVAKPCRVRIDILDALGRRVATLVDRRHKAGGHAIHWNGADRRGRPVGAGLYLCRFRSDDHRETHRMLVR